MTQKDFPVGSRVIVVSEQDGLDLCGYIGVVVGHHYDTAKVAVKLLNPPARAKSELHSCRGLCQQGQGWTFSPSNLRIISSDDSGDFYENITQMLRSLLVALWHTRAGKNLVRLAYHKDRTGEWVEIVEINDKGEERRRDVNIEGNSGAATIIAVVKEVM